MKFRKKPVVIEAFQYTKSLKNFQEESHLPQWAKTAYENGKIYYKDEDSNLYISTLEGEMRVRINDYIIQGVHGEIYPCEPNIFYKTYEQV